jgi:hypothetical protein
VSENFIQGVRRDTHTQIYQGEKEKNTNTFVCLKKIRATVKKKRDQVSKRKNKRVHVYICLF